jgi:hypothetical protein
MLDLFFKFFSIFSLRVVPSLFLRDMYRALRVPSWQPPPKTPNYSPMLHNAILAVASVFSDDPRIRNANRRKYFVVAATACLEAECEKPTVSLVHSLSLLGTYFSTSEDLKILGDGYFAMSARVGLSRKCSSITTFLALRTSSGSGHRFFGVGEIWYHRK